MISFLVSYISESSMRVCANGNVCLKTFRFVSSNKMGNCFIPQHSVPLKDMISRHKDLNRPQKMGYLWSSHVSEMVAGGGTWQLLL